jgi:hypothetical protein
MDHLLMLCPLVLIPLVYMYIFTRIFIHIRLFIYIDTNGIHVCIYTYVCPYSCIHIHTYTRADFLLFWCHVPSWWSHCTHIPIYRNIYTCIYIYIYIHTWLYIYVQITSQMPCAMYMCMHTYIKNTHKHTYIQITCHSNAVCYSLAI